MTLLEKLDRFAYYTPIPFIGRHLGGRPPRALRWTPLFVMAVLIAGYMLMTTNYAEVETTHMVVPPFWIGFLLFVGAFLAACFLRLFGPRFNGTLSQPLDERELIVKARAHAISGIMLVTLAMLGCWYLGIAGMMNEEPELWRAVFGTYNLPALWRPRPYDWINLGLVLQASRALLPTLIASWLQPRASADGED